MALKSIGEGGLKLQDSSISPKYFWRTTLAGGCLDNDTRIHEAAFLMINAQLDGIVGICFFY